MVNLERRITAGIYGHLLPFSFPLPSHFMSKESASNLCIVLLIYLHNLWVIVKFPYLWRYIHACFYVCLSVWGSAACLCLPVCWRAYDCLLLEKKSDVQDYVCSSVAPHPTIKGVLQKHISHFV